MHIKAIQTTYKGVLFRSRLEARHALLFDELGIKWEYEMEGYKLPNGQMYLPDFFLPEVFLRSSKDAGVFFEVKPSFDKARESEKIFYQFDRPLVVACGTPPLDAWNLDWLFEWWNGHEDNYMFFKFCKKCRLYEIEFCEGSYCFCRKCKKPANEVENWEEIASKVKSFRF